jgi:NRPS condensation-like uncharacterized protein
MQRQPASSLDLFTDSVRLMGDATMIAVMEFDRHLDIRRLEDATSRCLDAFPILRSRLVRGHGPAYWEFRGRQEGEELVSVKTVTGQDYRPYIALPVDPHGDIQSRVRILRSQDRDILVINVAHAAADGTGLMVLANTLLRAYVEPSSVPRCAGGLPVRDTLWTSDLIDGPELPEAGSEMEPSMWPSLCGRSKEPSTYHRVTIPPEEVIRIKQAAHDCGGTINDVLLSAYFLSLSDVTGHNGPQCLSFPVNLRQHLSDGSRIMSNQAANVAFMLHRESGDGTAETLNKVVKETRRLKTDLIGVREQIAFDRFSDPEGKAVHQMVQTTVKKQDDGLSNAFISNPGPFNLPPVEGLVDAYVCYPGSYMPSTCFVVSTFRGTLSVTMGYQNDIEPRDVTREAMEAFVKHLSVDISKASFS